MLAAVAGVAGQVLGAVRDGEWHSVRDVARRASVSPASASHHLGMLLSRGVAEWRADHAWRFAYRLKHDALFAEAKRPVAGLEREISACLRASIGDRFYLGALLANLIYGLIDWYGGLNLIDVHVSKSDFGAASKALLALSDYAAIVPYNFDSKLINQAMRQGPVIRLLPRFNLRWKAKVGDLNVMKLNHLLLQLRDQLPAAHFRHVLNLARERGMDESDIARLSANAMGRR